MKKIYYTALIYMIVGLLSGIYEREFTKAMHFTGYSMLSILHTHLLILGMFFFLLVLVIEKSWKLTENKLYNLFFWTYNIGVTWSVLFLAIHGTMTVLGKTVGPAVSGLAGFGHMILTAGLILFFVLLKERITVKN
ncbi:DUF2871 domain-containing protein [Sporolactobacillus spathodeae]|uniref:DUF2871 domain-containing protein n=1 Tax=Sporolactobacillus spathodeae TaxID=1465502 RepID=A0ABS2Q9R4_9BACL|nr:DUF2871 domain-containing protein [Sporolactobacillus spathodeae]MBM7658185.1 hypothetical protein [Sporolactobacillus spathodeae]